jgi:hypothetical protein
MEGQVIRLKSRGPQGGYGEIYESHIRVPFPKIGASVGRVMQHVQTPPIPRRLHISMHTELRPLVVDGLTRRILLMIVVL